MPKLIGLALTAMLGLSLAVGSQVVMASVSHFPVANTEVAPHYSERAVTDSMSTDADHDPDLRHASRPGQPVPSIRPPSPNQHRADPPHTMVTICHRGKVTLTLPEHAASKHLEKHKDHKKHPDDKLDACPD